MIVVGELINASRKAIGEAILNKNAAAIQKVAKDQEAAGANYIDVNAGIFVEEEADYLKWLVEIVQDVVEIPCCIDSPSPKASALPTSERWLAMDSRRVCHSNPGCCKHSRKAR